VPQRLRSACGTSTPAASSSNNEGSNNEGSNNEGANNDGANNDGANNDGANNGDSNPPPTPSPPPPSPSPSDPPSPSFPPGVTAGGDPHIVGAHGDKFDFKGEDGVVYALFSSRGLAVNGRFTHDVYSLGGTEVHGSFITEVYVTARTAAGETVYVDFSAANPEIAHISIGAKQTSVAISPFSVNDDALDEVEAGNVGVQLYKEHMHEAVLAVGNGEWRMLCRAQLYPYATTNKQKKRLDTTIMPAGNKNAEVAVAPHGLIGQTFDGDAVAVDGAQDDYSGSVVHTKAMGEGAIEGVAADYAVASNDPYAIDFKYSRFNSKSAAPRDVAKLAGLKRSATAMGKASGFNDNPDM